MVFRFFGQKYKEYVCGIGYSKGTKLRGYVNQDG